jgi:mannose/cellobiose epimerase-like protein (N-acyl-D-glucosamine 2-epimerase family)
MRWRHAVQHGLDFLQQVHADPGSGEPVWSLRWDGALPPAQRRTVLDGSLRCDGLATVMQAQAQALRADVLASAEPLDATFGLMERRFWQADRGCYADPAGTEGAANVQACEALMAAFEACGDKRYLDRAAQIADAITGRPQRELVGRIATAQLTQWARLLLAIERARPDHAHDDPLVHRARELFAAGVSPGWDRAHGGLAASVTPDTAPGHQGRFVVSDADKPAAAHAESIAAAAVLAERTLEGGYWDWYDRLWLFAWEHFIDHQHGGWYRLLGSDNRKPNDLKSPPGKTDARTMGACYEVLASLAR